MSSESSGYLRLAVQQANGFVVHLQQHLLRPDLLFGAEQDEFSNGVVHRHDGLALVHDEGGQVLKLGGKEEKTGEKAFCVYHKSVLKASLKA